MSITRRTISIAAAAALAGATGVHAQTVSIGTNPQGSMAYIAGAGVAKVAIEDAGVKMRVVPQGGPVVTLPLLNNGELDFTIAVSVVTAFARTGGAMFKGRKQENVYVAASLFPLVVAWYTRADSDIKTIADLKGKRIPTGFTKQKISGLFGVAMMATAGLSPKDAEGVPVPNGVRAVELFTAGQVDAVNWSLGSGATRKANASVGGIRVLSLEKTPESLARLQKVAPGAVIATIKPGPVWVGVKEPTNVLMAPFIVTAGKNTPPETVYKLVKALHANKQKLVTSHKAFGGFDPDRIGLDFGLPYHPGAEKFFKEAGLR